MSHLPLTKLRILEYALLGVQSERENHPAPASFPEEIEQLDFDRESLKFRIEMAKVQMENVKAQMEAAKCPR